MSNMSMALKLKNVSLKPGDQLKVKGVILHDADRIRIDLGWDANDLALHFNPRFDEDESVIVCNSKLEGSWGAEERQNNPLQRGSEVKIVLKLTEEMFIVELPGEEEVQFCNRDTRDIMSYVNISGDFKLKSFKIC